MEKEDWARQLSAFDLGVRQQTAQPTRLHEFLDFASEAALKWTPEERASWGAMIDKLSHAMEDLGVDLPNIDLVKTTGKEEFDAAYTRQRAIMFPERLAGLAGSQPRNAFFLLAHELFHVLSPNDSDLRDKTYALLGANRFDGIEFPAELDERRLSNPDAHTYEHAVRVQTASGNADVVPVNQSLVPLEEAILLPNFFDALDIILLAVDTSTSRVLQQQQRYPDQLHVRQHQLGTADETQLKLHHPPRGSPGGQPCHSDGVASERSPAGHECSWLHDQRHCPARVDRTDPGRRLRQVRTSCRHPD